MYMYVVYVRTLPYYVHCTLLDVRTCIYVHVSNMCLQLGDYWYGKLDLCLHVRIYVHVHVHVHTYMYM